MEYCLRADKRPVCEPWPFDLGRIAAANLKRIVEARGRLRLEARLLGRVSRGLREVSHEAGV